MDITQNHFKLFGLAIGFELDLGRLKERYLELQKALHPDRFSTGTEREQRLAVQTVADLNAAYAVLKSPLNRAQYLLSLKNIDLSGTAGSRMDSLFLMQQMALREELESIPGSEDPAAELNNMCLEVKVATEALFQTFIGDYQESTDQSLQHAREVVKKLQFMHKLQRELDNLEDQLVGY